MKLVVVILLFVGISVAGPIIQAPVNGGAGVPEINSDSAAAALALVSGTLLFVRNRRKK